MIKVNTNKVEEIKKKNRESAKHVGAYKPMEYAVLEILKQTKGKALSEDEIEKAVINNYNSFDKPPFYVGMTQEQWDELDDQTKAEYNMVDPGTFEFLTQVRTSFNAYIDVKFVMKEDGKKYLKKYKDIHNKTIEGKN